MELWILLRFRFNFFRAPQTMFSLAGSVLVLKYAKFLEILCDPQQYGPHFISQFSPAGDLEYGGISLKKCVLFCFTLNKQQNLKVQISLLL